MPTPEELEDAAAADAVRALKARLEDITRRGLALYESMPEDNPGGRAMVRNLLASQLTALADSTLTDDIPSAISSAAEQAYLSARLDAARQLSVAEPRTQPPDEIRQRADAAAAAAREELRRGARQMETAEDADGVLSAFSTSRRSVTRTETAARSTVNEALSEGTRTVTEAYGVSRLWVPERDACVHCLAYAGEVAGPGEDFRGGLTFGAKPLHTGPVKGAPLHPNCRCRIVPYRPELESDSGKAEAYKREALRSVLRGWSLPSESNRTRLDAAERALKGSALMPKSVQDYARRSVKRGSFSRGRAFPSTERKSELRGGQGLALSATPAQTARGGLDLLPRRTVGSIGDERRDALSKVNPNFGEPGYGINCVHVVAAAELRRRGYDVEATPLPTALWGNRGRNMAEALSRWREPGGGIRHVTTIPQIGGLQTNTLAELRSYGPGARAWIVLQWKAGGAHVFSAEVTRDGKTTILTDSQTGQIVKAAGYFSRANRANIVRVDDLVSTDAVLEFVKPAGSPF